MERKTHTRVRKTAIILFWLMVWQAAAVWTDNSILLAGPVQVAGAFVENIMRPDFLVITGCSFARIGLGFFLAFFAGLLLGALGYRFQMVEEVMAPVMTVIKSVPVASFVVILLIWFGSGRLSLLISFLIVFPNVYVNTVAGLRSTDEELLEMARVFDLSTAKKILYIYREALMPYLDSCLHICLGMSWKSGVAAEIIGLPERSLGERLYMSKIYLDTAGVFSWTVIIILLSFLFEKAVLLLLKTFAAWKPYPVFGVAGFFSYRKVLRDSFIKSGKEGEITAKTVNSVKKTTGVHRNRNEGTNMKVETGIIRQKEVQVMHIGKSYNGRIVLRDFTMTMKVGERYLLMAPSGAGKTTLLRIMTGLEKAEGGTVTGMPARVGMVFQEDRLCEEYDAICNIMLGMEGRTDREMSRAELIEYVREQAARILPEGCLTKPVKNLSGGMRRRVALLRAVLSGADVLILDEPFAGLDEDNRVRSAAYLNGHLKGKMLLATTHREEDVELLQGYKIEF